MIDESWEKTFNLRNWGQKPSSGVMRFAIDFFCPVPEPTPKVLDVGCGWGANLWYMVVNGFEMHGVDGSPKAIEESANLLRKIASGKEWKLQVADFCALPYPDNYFDAAIDVCALSCVDFDQAQKAYDEIFRVLKPGGLIYTQLFAPLTWEGCFPEGTYNRITSNLELNKLLHKFHVGQVSQLSRVVLPHSDRHINEWMIVAKKPEDALATGNS